MDNPVTPPPLPPSLSQPVSPHEVSWGGVARDVVIVFVLTAIGGFLVGFVNAIGKGGPQAFALGIMVSNLFMGIIAFTISGCLAKGPRWKHLAWVALFSWITGLVNLIIGVSIVQWFFSSIALAFMMVAGGGISFLFKK